MATCHHAASTHVHSLALRSQQVSEFYQPHLLIDINFLCGLCYNPILHTLSQDGWTTVLVAARYGHQSLVQELCETFGADLLHRKKVRAMQTVSGSEWLSELCMYPIIMCGCTHRMTVTPLSHGHRDPGSHPGLNPGLTRIDPVTFTRAVAFLWLMTSQPG